MRINRYGTIILTSLYVVGLIATLIILFMVHENNLLTASFWISILTIVMAETALWFYSIFLMQRLELIRRVLPGYIAIGAVLLIYLSSVLFYSLFTGVADLALKWYVIVHLVTFIIAVFIIGLLMIFTRSHAEDEHDVRFQISKLQDIEAALLVLQNELKAHHDPLVSEMMNLVSSLIEDVKYSDPITPITIRNNDHLLLHEVHQINEELALIPSGASSSYSAILKRLHSFKILLDQRNKTILQAK